jgi:hypothetical protein
MFEPSVTGLVHVFPAAGSALSLPTMRVRPGSVVTLHMTVETYRTAEEVVRCLDAAVLPTEQTNPAAFDRVTPAAGAPPIDVPLMQASAWRDTTKAYPNALAAVPQRLLPLQQNGYRVSLCGVHRTVTVLPVATNGALSRAPFVAGGSATGDYELVLRASVRMGLCVYRVERGFHFEGGDKEAAALAGVVATCACDVPVVYACVAVDTNCPPLLDVSPPDEEEDEDEPDF